MQDRGYVYTFEAGSGTELTKMRLRAGSFTAAEEVFIDRFAATGDANYAAEKAGFPHVPQAAHRLKNTPRVLDEVHARVQAKRKKYGEAALDVLNEIAHDKKHAPPGVRVNAAKALWDASGLGTPDAGDTAEPHEMTADQLGAARRAAELRLTAIDAAAAARAVDITPTLGAAPGAIEPSPGVFD